MLVIYGWGEINKLTFCDCVRKEYSKEQGKILF